MIDNIRRLQPIGTVIGIARIQKGEGIAIRHQQLHAKERIPLLMAT